MEEIWKDVIGYEGLYQVSNLGRVKSLSRIILNRGKVPFISKEKILKYQDCKGYNTINLTKEGVSIKFRLCRLVATNFIENPNNKKQVNHIDGNKKNDSLNNLEWVTPKENMIHASKNNLLNVKKGSENHMSKKIKCIKTNIVFDSIKEACLYYKYEQSVISRKLRGIYKNNTTLRLI